MASNDTCIHGQHGIEDCATCIREVVQKRVASADGVATTTPRAKRTKKSENVDARALPLNSSYRCKHDYPMQHLYESRCLPCIRAFLEQHPDNMRVREHEKAVVDLRKHTDATVTTMPGAIRALELMLEACDDTSNADVAAAGERARATVHLIDQHLREMYARLLADLHAVELQKQRWMNFARLAQTAEVVRRKDTLLT